VILWTAIQHQLFALVLVNASIKKTKQTLQSTLFVWYVGAARQGTVARPHGRRHENAQREREIAKGCASKGAGCCCKPGGIKGGPVPSSKPNKREREREREHIQKKKGAERVKKVQAVFARPRRHNRSASCP
jgi:hypothetical protein